MRSSINLQSWAHSLIKSSFLRFLVIGCINTLFGYLCYAVAIGILNVPLGWALLISQLAGVAFNFQTYGRLIFNRHKSQKGSFIILRFIGAYTATYGLNLLLLKLLTVYGISPYLAQLAVLMVVVPVSYILLSRLVWRKQ